MVSGSEHKFPDTIVPFAGVLVIIGRRVDEAAARGVGALGGVQDLAELAVQVLPLPDPQEAQELGLLEPRNGSNEGERGDASRTYPQTGGACSSTLTSRKSRAILKT